MPARCQREMSRDSFTSLFEPVPMCARWSARRPCEEDRFRGSCYDLNFAFAASFGIESGLRSAAHRRFPQLDAITRRKTQIFAAHSSNVALRIMVRCCGAIRIQLIEKPAF